jgi:hypothetical protein
MILRLIKLLVGILILVTLPVSVIIFLIWWVCTGDFLLHPILDWLIE